MTGYTSKTTTVTANPAPLVSTMDKIGIYQNGVWYRDNDGSGTWNAGDQANVFGAARLDVGVRRLEWRR